ncbi:MAG: potassium-transporting ATPase subunit KdpA [bacterium]
MSRNGWFQIILYVGILLLLVKPLGGWMAYVFEGRLTSRRRWAGSLERFLDRISGIDSGREMDWKEYTAHLLVFNALGIAAVYLLQRIQLWLPWNPEGLGPVPADLAFNTAVSFGTNTNWQAYGGETTLSYATQMLGLTVQNFLSPATGMAVLIALIRGIRQKVNPGLGNFYVDLVRGTLYVLLPLSLVLALLLVSQGVVQTFSPYQEARVMDPAAMGADTQILAVGPAASQIAIKQLGTNGGGFFNANSAHPFENPTPLSNFLEMLALLLIPAALCHTYGIMVRDTRQGWALLAAMTILFIGFLYGGVIAEQRGNPELEKLGVDIQAGGNLEGKEVRFGIVDSALWATATTAASNGSVNSMHDSFTPLGGLVPMLLIMLGEVVFGGVGSGLYGMLAFVIIAVFVAGLMVGRAPEYLGKKIEAFEMKMVALVVLIPAAAVLLASALIVALPSGLGSLFNSGAHGLSEALYAAASAANNNGSAFAGFGANTLFANVLLALGMLLGRYGVIVPILALAGSLSGKRIVPPGPGTLPTHTPLFTGLLIGVVLLAAALTFFPALALGPIVEHCILYS